MFYTNKKIASIIVPDSVIFIGYSGFYWCNDLTSVYYTGTAEEWAEISIDYSNTALTDATIYYYSETESTEEGNYWHYDKNGEIVVW